MCFPLVQGFIGMNAPGWSALGQTLLGTGAIFGGLWAIFNFRRARRQEAARWLQGVFRDFYLADTFKDVRELLEYNYPELAGPLLERRITDRHVPITATEMRLLQDLDTLFNYFEHVLYLEYEGQISRNDRQAVFEYWFDIMSDSERASVRRYAARFGFERVAKALKANTPEYVAVYGTLRQEHGLPDRPDAGSALRDRGECKIRGDLYDLGEYPGLYPGSGTVVGELFEVTDVNVFRDLDEYEKYDANDRDGSLYIRRSVRLVEPVVDAWVYFYNEEVSEQQRIDSGDWAAHSQSTSRA
jgi:gamma-glutamylcyclotransferase (GGCT)/AIG2-like uncharacterized protein YtfP